jgi:uncharacterized CHY-type Zn-finger protein
MKIHGVEVKGVGVDPQTRCAHYHSERDIIAIKFACCQTYYPCHLCHDACADHPAVPWPRSRRSEKAVLCGTCGTELTIEEYLTCGSLCPKCGSFFNPGCQRHYHLYFEV